MTTINLIKEPGETAARRVTLDDLILEIATIGGLRIWQHERGRDYEVTIRFLRPSGSEIEAKARHTDLFVALRAAIGEARALGAA